MSDSKTSPIQFQSIVWNSKTRTYRIAIQSLPMKILTFNAWIFWFVNSHSNKFEQGHIWLLVGWCHVNNSIDLTISKYSWVFWIFTITFCDILNIHQKELKRWVIDDIRILYFERGYESSNAFKHLPIAKVRLFDLLEIVLPWYIEEELLLFRLPWSEKNHLLRKM